ncbi:MAG: hypothetical protein ACM3WU_11915 [Bacillota bacterium]
MLKIGCRNSVLEALEDILDLLENRKFGLAEIKDEIKDIEDALKDRKDKGPISSGPFLLLHDNNAATVAVQNLDKCPIDVEVKLFDIQCCPPKEIDSKCLKCIGRCCAEAAVLCAPEDGIFEVVCCPDPEKSAIRAFASVHSGGGCSPDTDLVIPAADFLPLVCPFCKKDKCRRDHCHRDPCRKDPCRRCD